jgi:hypothetical protein
MSSTQRRKVDEFKVRPLSFPEALVSKVAKRREAGESVADVAKALKVGAGKAAMAELIATEKRVTQDDPAKLARAIAKDRAAGASWGKLSARYGVTEGTCRAAYTAATGEPWQASAGNDLRKRKEG